jgi:DNA-binding MarR family transcriptional regulator
MGTNTSSRVASRDVQAVLDGIRRIVQGLREASHDADRRTGLTAAQLFALGRVSEAQTITINQLAARTFTHQSSVSAVVSRLVARRLVVSHPDPRDRRRRVLALTATGRAALARAPLASQESLIDAVSGLPPSSRRTVARALGVMADAMAVRRQPSMFFEERGAR